MSLHKNIKAFKMSTLRQTFAILSIMLACVGSSLAVGLDIRHEWRYIDYVWKNPADKQDAIDRGKYNHTKIIPIDFQIIAGNRVLITTPRLYDNPASLSTVSNLKGDGGPLLQPYPNWTWHEAQDCSGITSVNRVFLDDCDRLWLVDSGKIGNQQICSPKLLAFDSETDRLLKNIEIPLDLSHNSLNASMGRLEIQVIETHGNSCEDTRAYIGDPEGYGLVIWDGTNIWRLENDDVYAPDPTATIFDVAGENVTLEMGVSSIVITPDGFIEKDYLLFKPLASRKGYAATLEDLHNSRINEVTYYRSNFTIPSQELGRIYSKSSGVLIGGFATQLVVACWNLQGPLIEDNVGIILEDDEALQFTSSAKIVVEPECGFQRETYCLMTNRLTKFYSKRMNFADTNFRIMCANLATLVNGTVCEPQSHSVVPTIEEKFFFEYQN